MARSWSVILASALTTTTGRSGRRSRTMAATRSMAWASCTEVPPNFITIMRALRRTSTTETRRHGERHGGVCSATEWPEYPSAVARTRSTQVSLRFKQLDIQHGCTSSAADGVVRKHGEFPVEDIAGTQPPTDSGHATSAVTV